MTETVPRPRTAAAPRLPAIDAARGVAVLLMAAYHFCWDLTFLDLAAFDLFGNPVWLALRTVILGGFLGLAGISLELALRRGIVPRRFLRRLALLAGCAAVISAASYALFPERWIAFGVLHCIALSSVLGLAFARLPAWAIAAAGAAWLAAPEVLAHPLFDVPELCWLGLAPEPPNAIDYVPLFPWFGVVLLGMALARLGLGLARSAPVAALAEWRPRDAASRTLGWAGRRSLLLYMLHQPVLVGLLLAVLALSGRPVPLPGAADAAAAERGAFVESCRAGCRESGSPAERCIIACACLLDRIEVSGLWPAVLAGAPPPNVRTALSGFVQHCSADLPGAPSGAP